MNDYLKGIIQNLPDLPGCYQYLDESGQVIYVGKAKNLKRRVNSYFNREHDNTKTRLLVQKIRDIRYIVVKTNEESLLLENNLIKKYKPRYNVLLKDDKTYPSIAVTKEVFPRIFSTRNRTLPHVQYFGPYSHLPTMYALLDLCKKLYKPRSCRQTITPEGIKQGKYKVCLDYHIKRCGGCCIGEQTHAEYINNIEACKEILRGNTAKVQRDMRERMVELAEALRFEEAQTIKEQYDLIDNYRAKSEVVSNTLHNVDVFNIETDEKQAFINYLHVVNGAITQAFTFEYSKRLDETDTELLALGVVEMRSKYESNSKEIIVPFLLDLPEEYAQQTIPQKGDKKKLLELSSLNVKQYKFDRLKQAEKLDPEQKQVRLMKELQEQLGLSKLPMHIELFDNSNIQGEDAVAACVVFKKLKPSKKDYRLFNIKTVVGPDDYASMKEVVHRRYARLIEEDAPLPDLIIADGGIGQMEVIRQVIQDELHLDIPIAGLAKNNRHQTREMLFGFPPQIIGLSPTSQLFLTLSAMQEEVHRFAIAFHRKKRSKRQTHSELDLIEGVGPKTKEQLIKHFGSVKKIKNATTEELQNLLGTKKGQKIYDALHNESKI
ncbi:MAG: excinuclease ABC subunit UvrC [Bacteroidaceae bacterium]|nr:excinuclease ABC subunit UvrC [Bacteroidaceae bacterium]